MEIYVMIHKIRTHKFYPALLFALLVTLLVFNATYATVNIDAADKWAWGTNVGWLNFNDANGGVTVYDDHLEGYVWAENVGWIRLGTYTGGGAHTYANDAAATYGVNNDGNGNLSGYAWGTNVGWINFDPAHSQVTIDPATGQFDGYAWGENIGWIHFKNTTGNAYNVVTTWQSGGDDGGDAGDDGGDAGGGRPSQNCPVGIPGGICRLRNWVKITVFANTVSDASSMLIQEKAGGQFQLGDRVFDVTIIGPDGRAISTFDPPIEVCLRPTNAQLKATGWHYGNLTLFHSHAGGPWETIYNTYEKEGKLCAKMWQLSRFALGVVPLPDTGFAPSLEHVLPAQPAEKAYVAYGGFRLEIPSLDVDMPIVGVPLTEDGWDVRWLGSQAGWLQGTAFPTWAGNTALTAHVWDADNNPGPFVDLDVLQHGDEIIIHAWGLTHTYEVRTVEQVHPDNLRALPHEDYDVLTLLTCQGFDETEGSYDWRLAVRAVLIDVVAE
jgi:LPXTG-site transpeptidase (sortase) family protein